ncbi:MAG: homocysteine S-methyltransferase family protein [Oscillospiraceae bacterium]|jgi:5-methyltetrahydrofolate--homocysteine methyltransferase
MDDIPLPSPFLLDGTSNAALRAKGAAKGDSPVTQMLAHPDALLRQKQAFAAAGADALCVPTEEANRPRLSLFGLGDQTDRYNRALVSCVKQAAQGKWVVGLLSSTGLETPPRGDADVETLVTVYAEQARSLAQAGARLFLADSMTNVAEARAAILAVREQTSLPILVSFACDGAGRTETGGDILAALIICQGMGAAGFGIGRFHGDLPELSDQVERLALYSRAPLMVLPHLDISYNPWGPSALAAIAPAFAKAGVQIWGGGASAPHIAALRAAIDAIDFCRFDKDDRWEETDELPCASEREARFISPLIDVGEPIFCSPHFVEDLLAAEGAPAGATKIVLEEEDDLGIFAANQYMIQEALCLSSANPALLAQALRIYNGRAFYDGTNSLAPETLRPLVEKYGLIVL